MTEPEKNHPKLTWYIVIIEGDSEALVWKETKVKPESLLTMGPEMFRLRIIGQYVIGEKSKMK